MRWRILDPTTGVAAPGCHVEDRNWCCASVGAPVTIDAVRLRVAVASAASAGGAAEIECPSCRFPCAPLEHATRFEVPPGRFRLSLEALRCNQPIGVSPPAVVRDIRAGETTNLGAIEILIPPGTPSIPACGDGGT